MHEQSDQYGFAPPVCDVHGGAEATALEFLHLNDPKNYKFLPPQFTGGIKPAGKLTATTKHDVRSLLNQDFR